MAFHNYRYMPCSNHLALLDVAITFLLMFFFCLFENTILEYRLLLYSLTLLLLFPRVQKALLHVQDNAPRNLLLYYRRASLGKGDEIFLFFFCVHLVELFAR